MIFFLAYIALSTFQRALKTKTPTLFHDHDSRQNKLTSKSMSEGSARSPAPSFGVGVESDRSKAVFEFVHPPWTKLAGVSSVLARRLSIRGEQGRDRVPSLASNVIELRIWDKIGEGGAGSLTPGERSVCWVAIFGDASQAALKWSSISWPSKGSFPSRKVDKSLSESALFWRWEKLLFWLLEGWVCGRAECGADAPHRSLVAFLERATLQNSATFSSMMALSPSEGERVGRIDGSLLFLSWRKSSFCLVNEFIKLLRCFCRHDSPFFKLSS